MLAQSSSILRVSKQWEQILSSMRRLWMHVDLHGAHGKVHWRSVQSYIRRSKATLTSVVVKNVSSRSMPRVLEMLSRCSNLEQLEVWDPYDGRALYELFKGSKQLKSLMTYPNVDVSQECIAKFLTALPKLERIRMHSTMPSVLELAVWPAQLPNLRSVSFGSQANVKTDGRYVPGLRVPGLFRSIASSLYLLPLDVCLFMIPSLFRLFSNANIMFQTINDKVISSPVSNLEEVRLDWHPASNQRLDFVLRASMFPRLRLLDISGLTICTDQYWPASLEHIRVHACAHQTQFPLLWHAPDVRLPRLHTLILSESRSITTNTVRHFLGGTEAPLQVLHIDGCEKISGKTIRQLKGVGNFDALTELNVSSLPGIDDSVVALLVDGMTELKTLNLSCTRVTGCSIKLLADLRERGEKPSIERLYVRHCEDVSWDAVTYGRAKGVEVFNI